jgi:N-acetylneuraminate synthase
MPERTLVIAEAGVNHDGSLDAALRLVDIAADAGADVVKFQTFRADRLATATAAKAGYQSPTPAPTSRSSRCCAGSSWHRAITRRSSSAAARRGMGFMSTAFDAESLAFSRRCRCLR